jgi:hypothetical protein
MYRLISAVAYLYENKFISLSFFLIIVILVFNFSFAAGNVRYRCPIGASVKKLH